MFLISKLEDARVLDRVIGPVRRAVRTYEPAGVRDALHGRWLGHPLHPALIQVPAGMWLSASFLDLWPGRDTAAVSRRLVIAGLAAAVPAAMAGWTDWAQLRQQQELRVGVGHALANEAAAGVYLASLAASGRAAKALRVSALTLMSAGGLLGGHLAYRQPLASPQSPAEAG